MNYYSQQEAQDHLQQLIADSRDGKTVVILGDNDQAVQLTPVKITHKPRKAGSARTHQNGDGLRCTTGRF